MKTFLKELFCLHKWVFVENKVRSLSGYERYNIDTYIKCKKCNKEIIANEILLTNGSYKIQHKL